MSKCICRVIIVFRLETKALPDMEQTGYASYCFRATVYIPTARSIIYCIAYMQNSITTEYDQCICILRNLVLYINYCNIQCNNF